MRAPGWNWPELEAGKLKRDMGTCGWAAAGLLLVREDWGELEHWDKAWGVAAGWGE